MSKIFLVSVYAPRKSRSFAPRIKVYRENGTQRKYTYTQRKHKRIMQTMALRETRPAVYGMWWYEAYVPFCSDRSKTGNFTNYRTVTLEALLEVEKAKNTPDE